MNIQIVSKTQKIVVNPATQAISIINAGPPGPGAGGGGSGGGIIGVIDGGNATSSYGTAPVIDGGGASG